MISICEFLVKKHQSDKNTFDVVYLEYRHKYYVYLLWEGRNSADITRFKKDVINKVSLSSIVDDFNDLCDTCDEWAKRHNKSKYYVGVRIDEIDNELRHTNFQGNTILNMLDHYTISTDELITLMNNNNWNKDIVNYI